MFWKRKKFLLIVFSFVLSLVLIASLLIYGAFVGVVTQNSYAILYARNTVLRLHDLQDNDDTKRLRHSMEARLDGYIIQYSAYLKTRPYTIESICFLWKPDDIPSEKKVQFTLHKIIEYRKKYPFRNSYAEGCFSEVLDKTGIK